MLFNCTLLKGTWTLTHTSVPYLSLHIYQALLDSIWACFYNPSIKGVFLFPYIFIVKPMAQGLYLLAQITLLFWLGIKF